MEYNIFYPERTNATEFYISIIERAILKNGDQVKYIHDLSELDKGDIVVTLDYLGSLRAMKYKPSKIITWIQGVQPEERHLLSGRSGIDAFLRYRVYHSMIEKYIINKSDLCLFVSESMRDHYEKKYGYKRDNYLIMPCFNTSLEDRAFFDEKYKAPTFLYSGNTLGWQCFPEIIALFKHIKTNLIPDAKLYIYSKDNDIVQRELRKNNVEAEIGFVPYRQLNEEIKRIKYGFLIRKDIAINKVATPTKMSSYLANGIIPIFSDIIGDFNKVMGKLKYTVPVGQNYEGLEKLLDLENADLNASSIKEEYQTIFNKYYNVEYYIDLISERLKTI